MTEENDRIPISFTDEGDPVLDKKHLVDLGSEKIEEIQRTVDQLRNAQTALNRQAVLTQEVNEVAGDKPEAFDKLTKAFQYLDQGLTSIILKEGLDKPASLNQALNIIEGSPSLMKEFNELFPGIEIDAVVEALSLSPQGRVSQRKLRKALNTLSSSDDSLFPGGQGRSTSHSLRDFAGLDMDDLMSLGDAQVKQIERQIEEEEA